MSSWEKKGRIVEMGEVGGKFRVREDGGGEVRVWE